MEKPGAASSTSGRIGAGHAATAVAGGGGGGAGAGAGGPPAGAAALPQSLILEHVSPATRLLEKRRQMFEVQEALDAQKEEFARREEAFQRREEGLRKKDMELQESLIRFNKFLQENESKRNRAEKRAQEEAKLRRQKEAEIGKLEASLAAMKEEYGKLEEVVGRNLKYQRYLETVQEAVPEDYPEVIDLLNRYKTLHDANHDLTDRLQRYEDLNESKRAEFVHYTKEQTNDILNFNNKIAFMQKALETSESEAFKMQNEVDGQIRSTSDRTLEIGQALMAVNNLLQRCTSKKHGNYLKHFQASGEDGQSGAQPGGQAQSGQAAREDRRMDELTRKGRSAMNELDVIAAYIVDFQAIAEEEACNMSQHRQAAAAAAAAAAADAAPGDKPAGAPPGAAAPATAAASSNASRSASSSAAADSGSSSAASSSSSSQRRNRASKK